MQIPLNISETLTFLIDFVVLGKAPSGMSTSWRHVFGWVMMQCSHKGKAVSVVSVPYIPCPAHQWFITLRRKHLGRFDFAFFFSLWV